MNVDAHPKGGISKMNPMDNAWAILKEYEEQGPNCKTCGEGLRWMEGLEPDSGNCPKCEREQQHRKEVYSPEQPVPEQSLGDPQRGNPEGG